MVVVEQLATILDQEGQVAVDDLALMTLLLTSNFKPCSLGVEVFTHEFY